ncbi:MAG: DUF697 domain-containing protein [Saprospiraceae bacterium]|nr:DUF697 domain-containing protein [Saprospiraceae bacterium]
MSNVHLLFQLFEVIKLERNLKPAMNAAEQKAKSSEIILNHVGFAMGGGLVPFPGADIAAVSAIQINMLRQLAKVYGVPFVGDLGRNIISAVVGGSLARLGASLVKIIPGVGTLLGSLSMPVLSGASTYALGQVVVGHFSNGGSLADMDFTRTRKQYQESLEEAKKVVQDLEKKSPPTDDPVEKLRRLSELHQAGILSDEEFKAQKAKLLERL